jgi:hypothetical protein
VPGQIILDPADLTTTGQWIPPGPIPQSLRQFGRFPDVSKWLPGDLLLFSAVHPGWIPQSIIRGQERGGYAPEDARWHHAAVYLGDGISICEAVAKGVRYIPIYPYILGNYRLRIRRDNTLTSEERWKIAMQSLTRLRSPYGFSGIVSLARQSWRGYWQSRGSLPPLGAGAVICSQLYSDSYSMVTGRLLVKTSTGTVKPADLSLTLQLTDVATPWLEI